MGVCGVHLSANCVQESQTGILHPTLCLIGKLEWAKPVHHHSSEVITYHPLHTLGKNGCECHRSEVLHLLGVGFLWHWYKCGLFPHPWDTAGVKEMLEKLSDDITQLN